ncbi:SusD/RagB family nutrient-binding outer membrane lipoprotein [Parabacteroides faecis]|uniref:SusD/RagB family nutrient-binding outer membrane lipoprotein n=1 Tax=Parabacteroides faecis TaxID=1217282 RepID=UPI002164416F|nr:SusD/RagB family nutrient-binding outer membrane lipoprotein [Parabacteroides faecis]MCS2892331.1 SusD/RagB family nutrient-binding outer membrane lipoprotein [Parabacteroides faecis]UVQ49028.1 SusD/RagB family nutrient-binding outer membrane lipoprotein [Parabacteroides faecis]
MKSLFKKYTLLSLVACTALTGCSDWLDVNDNPNTAEKVEAGYLFNYVAVCWSGNRLGGDSYIPISMSIQSQADGGDNYGGWGEAYYEISPYSTGNTWKHYYSVGGNNLQLAIEQAKNSSPENVNAEAQCEILLAEHVYEASMLWGDIPFSEAWKTDIKYPKFDAQEDVLNGAIKILDEAIAKINLDDKNCIDEYDPYYKGDMSKWYALAHSLKFRILMTMVDADPSKADDIKKLMEERKMISSSEGNMEFQYSENAGNENPKYGIIAKYTGGTNLMFYAHNNTLKPMQKYNDSRIPRYFDPGFDGEFRALDTREEVVEDADNNALSSAISAYLYRKDCPDLLFSYQEQLLLEAEVYARGLGVAMDLTKANDLFKEGVKTACNYYKADGAATETFLGNLPDLSKLSQDKAIYEIHLQQWIDLMDRPLECFVQWRRSGTHGNEVPALTVPKEASAKELLRRWDYSPDELSGNPNAPKESPKLWDAMWFDK